MEHSTHPRLGLSPVGGPGQCPNLRWPQDPGPTPLKPRFYGTSSRGLRGAVPLPCPRDLSGPRVLGTFSTMGRGWTHPTPQPPPLRAAWPRDRPAQMLGSLLPGGWWEWPSPGLVAPGLWQFCAPALSQARLSLASPASRKQGHRAWAVHGDRLGRARRRLPAKARPATAAARRRGLWPASMAGAHRQGAL